MRAQSSAGMDAQMNPEQSTHKSSKAGLSKAWLVAIILAGVLFVGCSVRFFRKVSQSATAYAKAHGAVLSTNFLLVVALLLIHRAAGRTCSAESVASPTEVVVPGPGAGI